MKKAELVRRYVFFLVGLFVNSLGIALITRANLGTSPISSNPYVLSIGFTPSLVCLPSISACCSSCCS